MDVRVPQKHFKEYYSINVTEGRETGPSNATSDDFVVICLCWPKYTETEFGTTSYCLWAFIAE